MWMDGDFCDGRESESNAGYTCTVGVPEAYACPGFASVCEYICV